MILFEKFLIKGEFNLDILLFLFRKVDLQQIYFWQHFAEEKLSNFKSNDHKKYLQTF